MSHTAPASDLLRSLGLLVDGPLLWGSPLHSRSPGVFVVELREPLAQAPLDERAIRRWLELVPQLRLDGVAPTPHELAQRLGQFWLPTETVLYVGRTARALGPRLAAAYATPLGARRPHPGGHWLKTLKNLGQLRIWWSETEAHEEYADALLSEVAGRQPEQVHQALAGAGPLLPFANLEDSGGAARSHGLTDFLSDEQPSLAASAAPASPRAARRPAAANLRKPATTRTAKSKTAPPAAQTHYLSGGGLARLQEELDELRNKVRPGVVERVKAARELGDLRENAEYESARKEQSFVEGRIQALEAMIKTAVVVEADASSDSAVIGSTVVVESEGERQTFVLVGASEADPSVGRISYGSPVGQALLGSSVGDQVLARLPRGEVRYLIVEVR